MSSLLDDPLIRHITQILLDLRQQACVEFRQSDENLDGASDAQGSCGVALKIIGLLQGLDDVNKLPPMTDEVIKEFEKQAKPIKIAEKDPKKHRGGIWTFNTAPQRKGAQVYTYRWTAELDGHHDSQFENDKGKKINEQHFAHIDMTTDGKTEKLRSVRVVKYHVTKETGEKGKLEELYKQTFK